MCKYYLIFVGERGGGQVERCTDARIQVVVDIRMGCISIQFIIIIIIIKLDGYVPRRICDFDSLYIYLKNAILQSFTIPFFWKKKHPMLLKLGAGNL